jgi:pyruvate/2-oxoglutarate dehydrogenase complex dihydrolipoamide acyltransferase (E2) component
MPQMGVSVAEGTITGWKKQPGDWIEADEPIVEISTDKVETEIPAPSSGRLKQVLVKVGQTVDVGTLLATIDTSAESGDGAVLGEAEGGPPAGEPVVADSGDGRAPLVTPVVRRMADQHDIDLSQVKGSGRRGRVTKKDVLAYLREQEQAEPAPRVAKPEPALHMESPFREEVPVTAEPGPAPDTRELSVMRKRIAEHMVRSVRTAAHCTTVVDADMSRIEAARGKHSYLPLVARATITALRAHPTLNATLNGDRLTVHPDVHLGIAVSLGEEGLIVPVIRNAHEFSHEGLATRIRDLADRARSKRLSPDDVSGGTFTITNPGAFGALLATPIINQPQVAILDLEAVVKRPVVVTDAEGRDSIAIRPMTYFCMSWDHRALDGALAARFLSTLKGHIEGWSG